MAEPHSIVSDHHPPRPGLAARYLDMALGVWLFVSGGLWNVPEHVRANAWACGVAIVAVAVLALWSDGARFLNSTLALWLLLASVAVFRLEAGPLWNHVLVSVGVFMLSLIPNRAVPGASRLRPSP